MIPPPAPGTPSVSTSKRIAAPAGHALARLASIRRTGAETVSRRARTRRAGRNGGRAYRTVGWQRDAARQRMLAGDAELPRVCAAAETPCRDETRSQRWSRICPAFRGPKRARRTPPRAFWSFVPRQAGARLALHNNNSHPGDGTKWRITTLMTNIRLRLPAAQSMRGEAATRSRRL